MTDKLEATLVCIPLSDLAEVRTGIAKGKPFDSDCVEVPYLRVANVQDGRLDLREVKSLRVSKAAVDRYSLRSGDVLLTEGGDIDKLGRGCVWHGQVEPCLHQNHVFAVRPKVHLLDATYLAAVAGSDYGRQYFLGCAKRTTNLASINSSQLKAFPVPFRPLPEQQKIAAILTAVDDKLDLIARQTSATQTLKQGLMQTLFTRGAGAPDAQGRWHPHTEFQDTELGRIPVGWRVGSIGSVAKESRERNAGQLDDRLLSGVSKEHGLVPMRDRVKGASTDRCRVVAPNAFAYNPMRINIGSIARNLQDHSLMVSPDYVVFSTVPERLLAKYLDHFRRSDLWAAYVGRSGDGGVRIRIYFDDLARFRLAIPPLVEQQRIVEMLDSVDDKLTTLTTQQTHYQSLKRGLMQKLLTGQWRVRVDAAALAPIHEEAPA